MSKRIDNYKVSYEIILKGVEPFTNIGSKITSFIDTLTKYNLISGYSWNIVDDVIVKHRRIKAIVKELKKIYKYFKGVK